MVLKPESLILQPDHFLLKLFRKNLILERLWKYIRL